MFGPQEVAQLLSVAADLDLQLMLLPQMAALMQVRAHCLYAGVWGVLAMGYQPCNVGWQPWYGA